MENYELHRDLFDLPPYVFPISLVCFGYPTEQQKLRPMTDRFDRKFIVFQDRYRRLGEDDFGEMFRGQEEGFVTRTEHPEGIQNVGQLIYSRKFSAGFAQEMRRSVRAMLETWRQG